MKQKSPQEKDGEQQRELDLEILHEDLTMLSSHIAIAYRDVKHTCQNTQRRNRVCGVIQWHICEVFNIPVPENSWKHEPKVIIQNKEVMLTYDLMIPSRERRKQGIVTGYSNELQKRKDPVILTS